MSQPAPNASGTLAATPLGHLLTYALDRRLTGTVVFEEPDHRKHAVYFFAGAPASVRTATTVALLGELAFERKLLERDRLDAALAAAQEAGRRIGEVFVERRWMDDETVEALLREQVARRVLELRNLPPDTAYGYYEGANFLERAGGPREPVVAVALILRLMRLVPDSGKGAEMLERLRGALLRFHVEAPLARFHFEPGEQAVVDVLRAKPQTLNELMGRGLLGDVALERLLYTLVLLRHFDLGTGSQPIGAERRSVTPAASAKPPGTIAPAIRSTLPAEAAMRPSTAAPPRAPMPSETGDTRPLTAAPPRARMASETGVPRPPTAAPPTAPSAGARQSVDDVFRREAEERAANDKQTHYEVLGLAANAPQSAIAAAYFQLAKRWHPDRLGPEHGDLRDLAMRIFARINEANQVLSDPEKRREYDAQASDSSASDEEQAQVQRVLRAATSFQKAQVLLKRNNLPAAEEAARLALADAPDEADHIALVAWLNATKQNADVEREFREVDRAAKLEPTNVRVRWYRGQLLKRLGKDRQALEDFRMIVEKDPRHVDAQREIRLYEMQRSQRRAASEIPAGRTTEAGGTKTPPPGAPQKGGLLGKLFKK